MSYRLVKNNPYNERKVSFVRKVISKVLFTCIFGSLIISSNRFFNVHLIEENRKNYFEEINYYEQMIESTASFFEENQINTPEACFVVYSKLLWNGYFSNNMHYVYDTNNKNNINGNYGIKIITGKGDCKNNEDFFCKLMQRLGYNAKQVVCLLKEEESIELLPMNILFGNHVITIVEKDGKEYYFDVTNLCSYEKVDNYKAENKEKGVEVILNPLSSYMCGYIEASTTLELLFENDEKDSTVAFSVDDSLKRVMKKYKILTLRKTIEPNLNQIYNSLRE